MLLITTEPFVLLLNFIYTVHISVIPQLVLKKVCNAKYNATVCLHLTDNNFKHEQDAVQETSTMWVLILFLATLLPSMFTVLIWGPLADKIGRKKVILLPPIFLGVQSAVYLLNATKFMSSPPVYLVIGALSTPVFGDFQGAYGIAYSYMADITQKCSKRTMRMAIMEGIMFFSGGPAGLASGYLLQNFGYGPVFIATLTMSGVMFVYVVFILPDPKKFESARKKQSNSELEDTASIKGNEDNTENSSLEKSDTDGSDGESRPILCQKSNRGRLSSSSIRHNLNPIKHLNTIFSVIWKCKSRGSLIALLVSFWFAIVAITGELYITVLFVKHRPFNLSSEEVGYYMALSSVVRGIGTVIVSQLAVRCFGFRDTAIIVLGLLSQTGNYVLLGLSTSKLMLFLSTISGIAIGGATSGLRSLMTKQVPVDSHGSILAAIEFVEAFGALLANVMSNTIYKETVSTFSGSAFFVLAGFSATAMSIVVSVQCYLKRKTVAMITE